MMRKHNDDDDDDNNNGPETQDVNLWPAGSAMNFNTYVQR